MTPRIPLLTVLLLPLACASPARALQDPEPGLVLVESSPVETTLGHPDLPDARDVWPQMVGSATRTLDVAQFYVSNAPGSPLEPVIPFARVVHAKYLVVDGEAAWLGTSNWEADYFTKSRNVGLVVEGAAFARELERFFHQTWTSPYAALVDPQATYRPPAVASEEAP